MSAVRKAALVLAGGALLTGCMHGQPSGVRRITPAYTQSTAALGVNSYLWRATLDTLAFMPLASADPIGGTIITDWYVNPQTPTERLKVTVYILDTRLRADGLNVTVFRQTRDASGNWVDSPVSPQTDIDIENSILTRARQIRLSNISG
jgi:hypothetical protein